MNAEAIKAARAEYYREWRKRNPDKVKETNARYWQKRAEKLTAQTKKGVGAHDSNG